jgi:RNA polymerase sigma-70 factor (ECF subfamily)
MLLQHYRDYLLRVAHDELSSSLAPKVAQSDLVQETCLQAARDFAGFVGDSEWELRVWLRQILLNTLRDADRRFRATAKRSISREVSLQANSDLARTLKGCGLSPSAVMISDENRSAIQAALNQLPNDYRRAIELRSLEGRQFEEVGRALGRSAAAARKIWLRAILKLADELPCHE